MNEIPGLLGDRLTTGGFPISPFLTPRDSVSTVALGWHLVALSGFVSRPETTLLSESVSLK